MNIGSAVQLEQARHSAAQQGCPFKGLQGHAGVQRRAGSTGAACTTKCLQPSARSQVLAAKCLQPSACLGVGQAHLVERLDHRLGRAAGVHLQPAPSTAAWLTPRHQRSPGHEWWVTVPPSRLVTGKQGAGNRNRTQAQPAPWYARGCLFNRHVRRAARVRLLAPPASGRTGSC